MAVPQDIITEILYRLPVKSLVRFRCLSKNFQSLISKPRFIKTHQNTLNRKHFILNSHHLSLYSHPFDYRNAAPNPTAICLKLPHVDMFTFHGSCNGLVLVSGHDVNGGHTLIVLNPMTRDFLELRPEESGYDIMDDLTETDVVFGFGYDSVTDDYKAVVISFHYDEPDEISVYVYSLKTKTWRWVCYFPYVHYSYQNSVSGVFVNGFLHWIAISGYQGSDDHNDTGHLIVAFSLADEKLTEVPLPAESLYTENDMIHKNRIKFVSGDHKLGVIINGDIWVMKEYGLSESWAKVKLQGLDDVSIGLVPMIFCENGQILVVTSDNHMLIYDIEDGSLCDRIIDTSAGNLKKFHFRGIFVESLVSPVFKTEPRNLV